MDKKTDCIVIGGGFAGIAAAVELARHGKKTILAEPRAYIGGRARSFVDRETGEVIDNGQHLLMGCYTHALSLFDVLGTRHLLAAQPRMRVDFTDPDGTVHAFDTSHLPGKAGTALGLLRLSGLSAADKFRAVQLALLVEYKIARPRTESVQDFLVRYHQPQRMISRFWEPIVLATLNAHPKDASARLLVEVLQRAIFADAKSSQLLFPAAGLSELIAPFPEWLAQHNGSIIHTPVDAIVFDHGSVRGAITPDGAIEANTIISCIPPRALARLLPPSGDVLPEIAAIAPLISYSPIVSVYLWFDRNFLPGTFYAMLGTTIQWVFNRRLLCDTPKDIRERYPGHVALTVSAADTLATESTQDVVQLCIKELERAFPEARGARLLHSQVIKEKQATMRATPETDLIRPPAQTAVKGFFLAGDWTNTGLPATIEGACQSGVVAARAALDNSD